MNNNYALHLRTIQSSIIQKLFEALKQIIVETNIECNAEGLRIVTMDESHTTLVRLSLQAEKFENYHCPSPICIGVDVTQLFSILKNMSPDEILTFFMSDTNASDLDIIIENHSKGEITHYKLKLLELNPETYRIPQHEYPFITNMPSTDFQKICRNMKNLGAEKMDIKHYKQQLIFRGEGEYAVQETTRTPSQNTQNGGASGNANSGLQFVKAKEGEMYAGTFDLEKLNEFTKCTSLGSMVTILMQNDLPLIFIYPVGNLGDITLCLAPLTINND